MYVNPMCVNRMDDMVYITFMMYTSGMFVPFFFLFLFPEAWIKAVIAGAGAAILNHKVEVLYWGWKSTQARKSLVWLMTMEPLFQPWAADVYVKTDKQTSHLNHHFLVGEEGCPIAPFPHLQKAIKIYDHHSRSETPMVLLKSHGCIYRVQISDFSFKFSCRSEWLAQLKRNPQLWFLFSSSLCLLSDHESPVTVRVEPKPK